MEEEKKKNKGLIIGLIIFLILCLILIFYFMFKMVYKEPSNNTNETSNTETNSNEMDNNDDNDEKIDFTNLTKYTLENGETEEVEVDGNKITLKRENDVTYLNDKETTGNIIYVSNLLIFVAIPGQYGEIYKIYDANINEIEIITNEDCFVQYNNFRLENKTILVDNINNFDNIPEKICEFGTYQLIYENGKIKYELIK